MARVIMADAKKNIVGYAIDLPLNLSQLNGVVLDAQYCLRKKDYGAVYDKLVTLETLVGFLYRGYPIGFKYLDSLIESKEQ